MNNVYRFLIIVLALTTIPGTFASAQTLEPEVDTLLLAPTTFGPNAKLRSERIVGVASWGSSFYVKRQFWRVTDPPASENFPTTLYLEYGYFASASDLAAAWSAFLNGVVPTISIPGTPDAEQWGDIYSNNQTGFKLLKGHSVFSARAIHTQSLESFPAEERAAYLEAIRDQFINRYQSLNLPTIDWPTATYTYQTHATGLTLNATVTSPFPVHYRYVLDDPSGQTVRSTNALPASGNNNITIALDSLAPGTYKLAVLYKDGIGRKNAFAQSFTVGNAPTNLTLVTDRDSIVRAQKPHRNEGANSLLTLEKITGKAARNLVGFDLSNIQTSGLTSASLVFTINPNEHVNGWGNGETLTVQTVNTPWLEGNGKSFGLNSNQQVEGSGSGVTWFSPIDENISNDSPNSVVQWDGGSLSANPATAPPVTVTNHQTGEISFDVTQDVLNGAEHGWLLSKDKENKGSKISFYSKEGAAAIGNPDFAPRLLLDYGTPIVDAGTIQASPVVAANETNHLKAITPNSEGATIKEVLQENATVAYTGQLLLTVPLNKAPVAQAAVRTAYRSWLNDSLTLANLAQNLA